MEDGMTGRKSWRDVLAVHPAADLFPKMTTDELRALGEDIKATGMKVPITTIQGSSSSTAATAWTPWSSPGSPFSTRAIPTHSTRPT
jgi:hypothetical protein